MSESSHLLLADSVPAISRVMCLLHDDQTVQECLAEIRSGVGRELWDDVLSEMQNADLGHMADDDYGAIAYTEKQAASMQIQAHLSSEPGSITTLILSDQVDPTATRAGTVRRRLCGDENEGIVLCSMITRYRRYASRTSASKAAIVIMLEQTRNVFPKI
jgi:hypothetical protein